MRWNILDTFEIIKNAKEAEKDPDFLEKKVNEVIEQNLILRKMLKEY